MRIGYKGGCLPRFERLWANPILSTSSHRDRGLKRIGFSHALAEQCQGARRRRPLLFQQVEDQVTNRRPRCTNLARLARDFCVEAPDAFLQLPPRLAWW